MKSLLKMLALTLAFSLSAQNVQADEVTVGLGGWSKHFGGEYSKHNLNEVNETISVEYKGFTVGTFNNSYAVQSQFIGYNWSLYTADLEDFSFKFSVKALGIKGYTSKEQIVTYIGGDYAIAVLPTFTTKYKIGNSFDIGLEIGMTGDGKQFLTTYNTTLTYRF